MHHSQMMAQMPGMSGHGNMKMDMQGDIAKLQAATGKQFERLFLDMMIPHHQMAIDMAKEATTKAEHAEIKEMARLTVLKQQGEVAEMKRLKGGGTGKTAKTKAKAKPKPKPKTTHTMSLGIIFDTSGSMIDKIDGVRDAVEHFVKSVSSGDEIFLIRFSEDAELIQDFTDDRRRILRAVEHLEPQGSTALYDAVVLGLQRITHGKHRKRALLLLTDGNDTSSSAKFDAVIALARKSEVIIYALGIGHGERGSFGHDPHGSQSRDTVDMRVLRAFAEPTGGAAYFLENAHRGGRDLVDEAATEVANELKQQYTLGYRPKGGSRDGGFRQIKVETADKSLRVRTKRGYYAARSSDVGGG